MRLFTFLRYHEFSKPTKLLISLAYIASCLGLFVCVFAVMLRDTITGIQAGCFTICILAYFCDILFMRSLMKVSDIYKSYVSEKDMIQSYQKSIDRLL